MKQLSLIAILSVLATACISTTHGEDLRPLSQALTFHAAFDSGTDADFSLGDKSNLTAPNDVVVISQGTGRFGNSLQFKKKESVGPKYHGRKVLNYNPDSWSTTVSIWLRLNPDVDLEPGYCDPVQIVGDDIKKGFIFLEWSRDETPRFFRYAIRPLFPIWNPDNVKWDDIPFEKRPMVQVSNAPFAADHWTHVVFTLENINDKGKTRQGKLFLDGELMGAVQNWDLTFGWNPEQVQIVLGAAYIGQMDDLAIFNRPLSAEEVKQLHLLKNGVSDLY